MAKKMDPDVKRPLICVRAPNSPFNRDRVREPEKAREDEVRSAEKATR
jgi:hypothetical protein